VSDRAKLAYLVRDRVYREVLSCLLAQEVSTTGDVMACLIGRGVDVPLTTLKRRLGTLVELGVVETGVVLRKKVWAVRKSYTRALQLLLGRKQRE